MQELDDFKIIVYDIKIHMTQSLRRRVLDWYHIYLNHPSGSIISRTIREVCYWKCLVTQAEMFSKTHKIYQQFKKRNTIYVHLPPKNIAELKPWYLVHVDLIGPYSKSIIQQEPGGTVIRNNASLTWIKIIDPDTGWFNIFKIPMFGLKEVALGNA